MPGLVDCHAHPTLFPDRQPFEVQLQAPDEMLALTAVRQLTRPPALGRDHRPRLRGARADDVLGARGDPARLLPGSAAAAGRPRHHPQRRPHPLGRRRRGHPGRDPPQRPHAGRRRRGRHQAGRLRRRHEGRHPVPGVVHRRRAAGGRRSGARAGAARRVAHARATQSIENCVDAGIDAIAHVEFLSPGRDRGHGRRGRADRPAEARSAGGGEAGRLAGVSRSESAVERLGHGRRCCAASSRAARR